MAGDVGNHRDQADDVTAAVIICGPTTFVRSVVAPPAGEQKGGYLATRLLGAAASDEPELARTASSLTYASASAYVAHLWRGGSLGAGHSQGDSQPA